MTEHTVHHKRQDPLVSMIIPVYNAASYLDRCLDSVLGQTYRRLEILLVDDGSTDHSGSMCDATAAKDGRVRVIHRSNGGLMNAWMTGVGAASGEYLCFLDSDDWIDLCMVEELCRNLPDGSGGVVCCNYVIERQTSSVGEDGSPVFKQEEVRHRLAPGVYEGERLLGVKRELLGNESRTVSMSRCMKLFPRALIEQNLHYCNPSIRMGEDVNIVLPALLDAASITILPDACYYHYYYNTASMVHAYDPAMFDGILLLMDVIHTVFEEKGEAYGIDTWREQCEREGFYLCLLAIKNELRAHGSGCRKRIRRICAQPCMASGIQLSYSRLEDRTNRLLLWVARRPDVLRCLVGRGAFRVYGALAVHG